MNAKAWQTVLVLVLLAGILAGCGTAVTTETEPSAVPADGGANDRVGAAVLTDSYENALPVSSQLALGTFLLEGTENEVSRQQAGTLLPLWQIVQSGTLKSEGETDAVLKQIEGAMTPAQLAAIGAMQLTLEDVRTWAQEQGVSLGAPGDGAGGFALPEDMRQKDLEAMRAAREAGAGGFAPPERMSQEAMEAMRATAEANGMTRPGGAGGMGAGQLAALAGPLVEQLIELAHG